MLLCCCGCWVQNYSPWLPLQSVELREEVRITLTWKLPRVCLLLKAFPRFPMSSITAWSSPHSLFQHGGYCSPHSPGWALVSPKQHLEPFYASGHLHMLSPLFQDASPLAFLKTGFFLSFEYLLICYFFREPFIILLPITTPFIIPNKIRARPFLSHSQLKS